MECLLCGHDGKGFVDTKAGIEYCSCERCGGVMKLQKHFMELEEQKNRYDLHTNSEDNADYRGYFEQIVSFVLPHTNGVLSALDFGCGASHLLAKILGEHSIECDSYDPIYSPQTSYRYKKYDLIISIEVFEHLHDPKKTLGELVTLLDPNGYLVIGTAFVPKSTEEFLKWYYRLDPTHIVFYTPRSFEILADEFGLEIVTHNEKNLIILKKH